MEDEPWTCRTCTFINQPTFLSCGACGVLKPHQVKLPSLASTSTASSSGSLGKSFEGKRRSKEKTLLAVLSSSISSTTSSSMGSDIPTPPPLTPPGDDISVSTSPPIPLNPRLIEDKWRERTEWGSRTEISESEEIDKLKKELEAKEIEIRGLKDELRSLTLEKKNKDQESSKKVTEFQNALDKSENTTARVINLVLDLLTETTTSTLPTLKEKLTSPTTVPPTSPPTSPPTTPTPPTTTSTPATASPSTESSLQVSDSVSFETVKQRLLTDARKIKSDWNLRLEDELSKARSIEERDRERFQELRECVVCMETLRTCVFQPCSHVAACSTCASTLTECPVCRKQVTSFVRAFIW